MSKRRDKLAADFAKVDVLVNAAMNARDDAIDALCAAQYEVDVALGAWGPLYDRIQLHSLKRG